MNEIMLEAGRFVTTGVLDETFFRKNQNHLLTPKYTGLLLLRLVLLTGLGLAAYLWLDQWMYLWMAVLFVVLHSAEFFQSRRRVRQQCIARMKESSGESGYTLTTSFTDEGMKIVNEGTGGQVTLSYSALSWARETEEHVLIITKAVQLGVVFKDCLTEQESEELISFLRNKGVKVKTM